MRATRGTRAVVRRRPGARSLAVAVAAGAALVALATARPAAAQNVRVIERQSIRSDSVIDRVFAADVAEVKRMVTAWREREATLVRDLRAAGAGDATLARRLEEQLALHTRDGFAIMSAIQARCIEERAPRPAGFLGLNLTSEFFVVETKVRSGGVMVTSVEPGSPAERAGVLRGDRVVSIAGLDARERVPDLMSVLVPGRSVVVRVEREGVPRDYAITVARRPEGFGDSCGEFERTLIPMGVDRGRFMVQEPGQGGRRVVVESRSAEAVREPEGEMRFFIFGPGAENKSAVAFFAGAEFRALDADWGEVLGVRNGVIVAEVAPGSAAAASGLKGGDVVVAIGRTPVSTPLTLVQMLMSAEQPEATLGVMRARERKSVTLKWGPR